VVVIKCQKSSILPRERSQQVRGKKAEGNDRTTGLQDYGLRDELCDGAERREMGSGRTADCPPRRAQSSLLFPVIRM
jgi:hypothetical protein